jgi:hypothetical protein
MVMDVFAVSIISVLLGSMLTLLVTALWEVR